MSNLTGTVGVWSPRAAPASPGADFIEALAERKLDVVQIDPDELEQEVNRARSG